MKTRKAFAAQEIRRELKANFPGIKFRVKSSAGSTSDSVHVYYVDGPQIDKVEALLARYERGHFNGMTDSYEYKKENVSEYAVNYLFVNRELSSETMRAFYETHIQGQYSFREDTKGLFNLQYAEFIAIDYDPLFRGFNGSASGYGVIRSLFLKHEKEQIRNEVKEEIAETVTQEEEIVFPENVIRVDFKNKRKIA